MIFTIWEMLKGPPYSFFFFRKTSLFLDTVHFIWSKAVYRNKRCYSGRFSDENGHNPLNIFHQLSQLYSSIHADASNIQNTIWHVKYCGGMGMSLQLLISGLPPSGKIRENQGKLWPSGKSGKVREFQWKKKKSYHLS